MNSQILLAVVLVGMLSALSFLVSLAGARSARARQFALRTGIALQVVCDVVLILPLVFALVSLAPIRLFWYALVIYAAIALATLFWAGIRKAELNEDPEDRE